MNAAHLSNCPNVPRNSVAMVLTLCLALVAIGCGDDAPWGGWGGGLRRGRGAPGPT